MNPYGAYNMLNNSKKIIDETPESTVDTAVDHRVNGNDRTERIAESACETIKIDSDTASLPIITTPAAKDKTLADLFGEELSETFRCTESGDGMYATISMEAEGMKINLIFIGGVQRIAFVTEKLVPLMACLYLFGGLIILIARIQYLPAAIGMIFKFAFMPQAIIGGGVGAALKTAISQGAKRGLFSNEAGMGSTPHAHAIAKVEKPHDQGVVAMIGVFIDTFIVLTMTALVVISCLYAGNGPLADGAADGIVKTNMAQLSFGMIFGDDPGSAFVAICLLFFAFSTILSWNLFGKLNVQYLFKNKKAAFLIYEIVAIMFIFLGSLLSNDLVWELTDFFNYLMVLPNAIALIALGALVASAAKEGEAAWKSQKVNKN